AGDVAFYNSMRPARAVGRGVGSSRKTLNARKPRIKLRTRLDSFSPAISTCSSLLTAQRSQSLETAFEEWCEQRPALYSPPPTTATSRGAFSLGLPAKSGRSRRSARLIAAKALTYTASHMLAVSARLSKR